MDLNNPILIGKVKSVFNVAGEAQRVLIRYEDRVTAGNGKKELWQENKGSICCEISKILFEKLEKKGVRTHYINTVSESIMCCKRVEIIPVEVVVRNITAGSIVRQTTLEEGTVLSEPLVEYFLKDDAKDDPLLTYDRVRLMGIDPQPMKDGALLINTILQEIFNEIGLTLVDFKLEFGYDFNKNLLLADELSPDGMRLWKEGTMESFDKDLFRKDKGDIVDAYQYILNNLQ